MTVTIPHVVELTLTPTIIVTALVATFTATEITALAVAVAALITAIFTGIVNVLTVMRATKKVDEVSAKADVIKGSVDGAASASVAKITALEDKVAGLVAQLAEKRQDAAVAGASAAAAKSSEVAVGDPAPAESLKQIDKNTAETASNTARVEASVQDLKDQK